MSGIIAGAIIDGYELIRVIGQGGFGTVWVARSQLLHSYVALKVITQQHGVGSQRELNAVQAYKKLAIGGLGSGLMPIEHVGLVGNQVFYVMPLSDGVEKGSPADVNWTPLTLSTRIARHTEKGTWFTSQEIASLFTDICKAAQTLSDAGLAHRDIKPDNILFFQGRAVISDVSLVTDDLEQGTRYGTPGFSAPSWYVETGGKIDMFSIAATLFTVLTGQSPDKMGRAAFRWPPGGKDRLSESEQNEWARLHRVVLRVTHEDAAERFITFTELSNAIHKGISEPDTVGGKKKQGRLRLIMGLSMVALILIGLFLWFSRPELSPDEVWMKIVDAHRNGDLTKAHSYETTTGRRVAKWLFSQGWVNSKLKAEVIDRSLLGNQYEMECHVIEDGKSETAKLIFKREADDEWRFDDIYLMDLKGVDFHMKLSRFLLNPKAADAELAAKNVDKPNLPEVRFALGSL